MNKIVIFPNTNGSISMLYPALNCGLTLEQIAKKDVPKDVPYLIIEESETTNDHTFFEAFEANFSNPDGYGMGHEAWFAEQESNKQEVNNGYR